MAELKEKLTLDSSQHDSALKNATKEVSDYSRTVKATNKEIEKMQNAFSGCGTSVANFFGNLKSGNWGNAATSIKDLAGNLKNLSTGFSAAAASGGGFGAALGALIGPLGVVAGAVAGVGVALYKLYDYNSGLEEMNQKISQITGDSGDALIAFRSKIEAVASTYKQDTDEIMSATNSFAKGMNVSYGEAADLISKGFAAGANVDNQFLDTLKEYPRYFKEAGLSAEEYTAIAIQASKQGVVSDKALDVIKEGNLRIREMTTATADALDSIGISSQKVQQDLASGATTTFEVMQQVSDKLSKMPDSASKVGTALADIFGGPGEDAGYQYITMLKDMDLNLDNVMAKSGDMANLQEQQKQATEDLKNSVASLFDFTQDGFTEAKASAKLYITQGLTKIIDTLRSAVNYTIDFYNKCGTLRTVINVIIACAKTAYNVFKTLFSYIIMAIKVTANQFKGYALILEGLVTFNWDKVKSGFTQAINSIGRNLKDFVSTASKNGYAAGSAWIDAINESANGHIDPLKRTSSKDVSNSGSNKSSNAPTVKGKAAMNTSDADKKAAAAAAKAAKEEEKRVKELEKLKKEVIDKTRQLQIDAVDDAYQKQCDSIDKAYNDAKTYAQELIAKFKELNGGGDLNTEQWDAVNNYIKAAQEKQIADQNKLDSEYAEKQKSQKQAIIDKLSQYQIDSMSNTVERELAEENKRYEEEKRQIAEIAKKYKDSFGSIPEGIQKMIDKLNSAADKKHESKTDQLINNKNSYSNVSSDLSTLQQKLEVTATGTPEYYNLQNQIKELTKKKNKIEFQLEWDGLDGFEKFQAGWSQIDAGVGAIDGVVDSFGSLIKSIDEGADAWTIFTGIISTVTTTLESVGTVMQTIDTITQMLSATNTAATAQDTANTQTEVANNTAKMVSDQAVSIGEATKNGASLPFPANIAAIAAGVAAVIAAFAMIGSFADGGIINGASRIGDMNLARVNGGEMILNGKQQSNLFHLIDKGGLNNSVTPNGNVEFTIKGDKLYGVLKNYGRVKSTIGKNIGIM